MQMPWRGVAQMAQEGLRNPAGEMQKLFLSSSLPCPWVQHRWCPSLSDALSFGFDISPGQKPSCPLTCALPPSPGGPAASRGTLLVCLSFLHASFGDKAKLGLEQSAPPGLACLKQHFRH